MRDETKKLIQMKTIPKGNLCADHIHARDIRGIINTETELLQKTIKKMKTLIIKIEIENSELVEEIRRLEHELSGYRTKERKVRPGLKLKGLANRDNYSPF